MARSNSTVTQVVAIGIGAALFFVVSRFIAIPTPIPNTTISIQYAILAVFVVLYGPLVGALAGIIGHILVDATGYGIWISWELATAVFALLLGLVMLRNRISEGDMDRNIMIRFVLGVVIAHAVAWLAVAPLGDVLIQGEPPGKSFTQGVVAFVANSLTTAIVGGLVLAVYARTRTRTGSLTADR